jgi:EF hand
MRFLYSCLLRLHPRQFRERFGDQMMSIFEEAASVRLLGDALLSVVVQWGRRWAFRSHQQPVAVSMATLSADVSMFHTLDTYKPRRAALIQGAVLSAIIFWALTFAATQRGHPLKFLGSSPHPHSGLLTLSELVAPDATLLIAPPAADPWHEFAARYFKIVYVLDALDADHDYVISASEIAAAPAALRKLDLNGDGRLTAEECGMKGGSHELFMRSSPVLAALDTNHDAEISAAEIRNAAAALKRLDLNGDGQLVPVEIAPEAVAKEILLHGK